MENIRKENNLITNKEIKTLDSREVAQMLGKEHSELLKEIEGRKDGKNVGLIPTLTQYKIDVSKYFISSTYKTGTRKYKCYLITNEGCRILGNKLQGAKSILFHITLDEKFKSGMTEDIKQDVKMLCDTMKETLQRKEIQFLDMLEEQLRVFNITGIRQYTVLSYKIDYYIPKLNIAIEYDENGHSTYSYDSHEGRQKEIEEELNCRFIRVTDENSDSYNCALVIKEIFNL